MLTLSIYRDAWKTVNAIRYKKVRIEHLGVTGSCCVNSEYSSYILIIKFSEKFSQQKINKMKTARTQGKTTINNINGNTGLICSPRQPITHITIF